MSTCNRFYRFSEFGRELVYDTGGATAFFVNEVEAHLLDLLQEGKSLDECMTELDTYTAEEITKAVQKITDEGLLSEPHIDSHKGPPLYTLDLNVIQECNLCCKYCYSERPGVSPVMSEKTAHKAVDFITQFADGKQFCISFYGGEPLLNFPVIKSTIEYASQKIEKKGLPDITYNITTNGTLLTDDVITFLAQYKTNIEISIDGPAAIHDTMRISPDGEGTHAGVMDRLGQLTNTPGTHVISVSAVITKHSRLKDVYQYLYQFPFKNINISCVRPLHNRKENKYALSEYQMDQYTEDMRGLALEYVNLLLNGVRPPYNMFERKILQLWNHVNTEHICPAGITRFGVSSEGDVYPCGFAADRNTWKLGTVRKLKKSRVDEWRARVHSDPNECSTCWACSLCVEKCPLQARDETRCFISRHSTRLAIGIYAAVKEKNEIMLASLVDEKFLSKIRKMIQKDR